MLISVVNLTEGATRLPTDEVLRVVRAVNRQLHDDFAPYWSIDAELRLVSAAPAAAGDDRTDHTALRGDGILYLISDVDSTNYLGYHALHAAGIPFGFVCVEISRRLGEPWSVTLSHEALEMVADPDTNLLCKGPHPDPDKSYDVFHWFEMSDAVQAESYDIDGIPVSNFVLPLYFTGGDELDGRNDFLDRTRVRSFGVKPGGYVGFFDPVTGTEETHEADSVAHERAMIRGSMRGGRRHDRRLLPRPLAPAISLPEARSLVPGLPEAEGDGRPRTATFEGFYVKVAPAEPAAARRLVQKIALRCLGSSFEVEPFWPKSPNHEFLVRARSTKATAARGKSKRTASRAKTVEGRVPARSEGGKAIEPATAWESTYALRNDRDVVYAEPLFELELATRPQPMFRASGGAAPHLPGSVDPLWSLELIGADKVWATGNRGKGIRIGHPDTGYTLHPELAPALVPNSGYDFLDDDADPEDDLGEQIGPEFPGHGTSTASVIASPEGSPIPGAREFVSGSAPAAKIVPYRVSRSVIILSTTNLARAIRRAADDGVHVISISMGGLLSSALHEAVKHAVSNGVIVLAAAGNNVGFVVWPAAYEEAIAVAACNVAKQPWSGSSHGSAVDVTAPGESVWRAETRKNEQGTVEFKCSRSSGTSYAVATAAGVAALWLAKHGRAALLQKYGPAGLCAVFKELLRTHGCDPAPALPGDEYGSGILNAEKLLAAPLPATAPAHGMLRASIEPVPPRAGTFTLLAHLLPEVPRSALSERVRRWLRVSEDEVPRMLATIGEELAFHFATDPELRRTITLEATDSRLARRRSASAAEPHAPNRIQQIGSSVLRGALGGVASRSRRPRGNLGQVETQ